MKKIIIAQRKFKARGPEGKGLIKATAQLSRYGEQGPGFSLVETDGCANHERILEAMPALEIFAKLHLCDRQGAPIHAVANALHFVAELNMDALARHLRLPVEEAQDRVSAVYLSWQKMKTGEEAKKEVVDELSLLIQEIEEQGALLKKAQTEEALARNLQRAAQAYPRFADPVFGVWTREAREKILEVRKPLFARNARPLSYRTLPASLRQNLLTIRKDLIDLLEVAKDYLESLRRDPSGILAARVRKLQKTWVEAWIEELRPRWETRAEEAMRILNGEEPGTTFDEIDAEQQDEDELDPETEEVVVVDGEPIEVVEIWKGGYLPMVNLGAQEWYLAEDFDRASEAAQEYWRDKAANDKEEFVEIVGKETLVDWAMGVSSGPGTCRASSLEEWLTDCVGQHPEEKFATYDGEQVDVEISRALAEALGFDCDEDWNEVLGYRAN